jgi:hypothetical protein
VSAIILPRNYRGQPQQAPQIDWSNPLARGLQVAWVASHPRQVLSNPGIGPVPFVALTAGLTAEHHGCWRAGKRRERLCPDRAEQHLPVEHLDRGCVTQTGGAAAGGTSACSRSQQAPASGTADRSLYANSNNVAALLFDGGTKTATLAPAGPWTARAPGSWPRCRTEAAFRRGWTGTRKPARHRNGGYAGYGSSAYIVMGYGAGGGGSAMGSDGRISLFLWWNRALSTAEHRAIADAPYGVFAQPKRSWLSQVAAAPPSSSRPQGFIAM